MLLFAWAISLNKVFIQVAGLDIEKIVQSQNKIRTGFESVTA